MTINFALSLSLEGIELLHRVTRGWKRVGTIAVEHENLDGALAELRAKALEIEPIGFATKLIVPMDQIKYVALDSTQTNLDDIHAALDGATPYDLNDLVIDYERSGGRTHIAAVARETLQEAQTFASAHKFNPVAFVAVPDPFTFQKEVFFGATSEAAEILGADVTVERDQLPVMKVGTRVKSRLLILEPLPDAIAEAETALDLPPQLAPEREPEQEVEPAAPSISEELSAETMDMAHADAISKEAATLWVDRIVPEYSAPAPTVVPVPTTPPPVEAPALVPDTVLYIDRIVSEFHPPLPVKNTPSDAPVVVPPQEDEIFGVDRVVTEYHPAMSTKVAEVPIVAPQAPVEPARLVMAQNPILTDISGMDAIIAEYHLAAQAPAKPVLTAIAPTVAAPATGAALTASKPKAAAQTQPRKKTPLVALGLAASVAAAAVFAWSQWDGTAQTGPTAAPAVTVETVTAPPQKTPSIEPAVTADLGPTIPTLNILRMAPPVTRPVDLLLPPQQPAPISPAAPAQLVASTVGTPPQLDVTSAEQDTPRPALAAAEPRGQVLSPAEAQAAYDATGVWQRAPRLFDTPRVAQDVAVTLPAFITASGRAAQPARLTDDDMAPELSFLAPANPPPPDVVFNIDENGHIVPSEEGTITPEGAVVYAGLPNLTLRERPELTEEQLERMAVFSDVPDGVVVILGRPDVVPPTRPDDIIAPVSEADSDTTDNPTAGSVGLDGLTQDAEALAAFAAPSDASRPRARPADLAPQAPVADPNTPDITSILEGIIAEDGSQPFIEMTPQAVGTSIRPTPRPRNFASVVAAARERQASQPAPAAAAPVAPQNYAPVPGGVAVAATQEDAIRLRDLNLIGIYGRPNAPRALVRLSNGRYAHVEVGSSLDGGQVTAIGNGVLNYVKRGRTIVLELPGG